MHQIRSAMLATLREFQRQPQPALEHRLRFAPDIAALWYARSDLMRVIAAGHGEALARQHIASITSLFDGLLPNSATSRPSPLSSK